MSKKKAISAGDLVAQLERDPMYTARALELYGRYLAVMPNGDATVTKWVADLKNRKPGPITVSRQEKP